MDADSSGALATPDADAALAVTAPTSAERIEGLPPDETLLAADLDRIAFPDHPFATRFSAEDWKQRALYENDRRQHIEQELLRIRDDIDAVIRRAAVIPRERS